MSDHLKIGAVVSFIETQIATAGNLHESNTIQLTFNEAAEPLTDEFMSDLVAQLTTDGYTDISFTRKGEIYEITLRPPVR